MNAGDSPVPDIAGWGWIWADYGGFGHWSKGCAQTSWSVDELAREVGRPIDLADALASLCANGLIHRTTDDFVFASREAVHMDDIAL